MILSSWLERERVLRRISDPEGDEKLDKAIECLRKNFYDA